MELIHFLSKCIMELIHLCQKALLWSYLKLIHFQVDDAGKGWLEGEDVMIALRGVNSRLTEAEEEYLYRVSINFSGTGFLLLHGIAM